MRPTLILLALTLTVCIVSPPLDAVAADPPGLLDEIQSLLNQNQGDIAKAEVLLRQADTDLKRLRLDIAQEVRDAVTRYHSLERLRHTFESGYLEHAKLTVNAAETAYRVGGASLIEFLDAERTYTATQTDYLDTVFAARSSLTALERVIGKDLTQP